MSLAVQFQTMLSMIGMGVWLGAAIDTYGRFTKKRRSFHLLTAINDLLFWSIQGLLVFYVLLVTNEGEMRFYIFVALLCGYAAYQGVFQRIYLPLLERSIQWSVAIFRFFRFLLFTFIIHPLKWLLKLVYTLCMMLLTLCITIFLFFLKLIYTPFRWIGLGLYRITYLEHVVAKIMNYSLTRKIVTSIRKLFRKIDKEDD